MALRMIWSSLSSTLAKMKEARSLPLIRLRWASLLGMSLGWKALGLFQRPYASAVIDFRGTLARLTLYFPYLKIIPQRESFRLQCLC